MQSDGASPHRWTWCRSRRSTSANLGEVDEKAPPVDVSLTSFICSRRPIQNILSGRLARLILIQLQFVKKELLMAMQGLDQLFSANQVNLQLMAVTPAVMLLLLSQSVTRMVYNAVVSSSRGRFVESSVVVYRELRGRLRALERALVASIGSSSDEQGFLLSSLYRVHRLLLVNSVHFERHQIKQLQVLLQMCDAM
jgi:hypothetical protein